MKNILILADGFNAEVFLRRISQKDAGQNHYVVVSSSDTISEMKKRNHIEIYDFDPTSAVKLKKVLYEYDLFSAFVVMTSFEEANACLDNIRSVYKDMEVVILDEWGSFSVLNDSAVHVLDAPQLIANRLYDHLPNVPVVAQNVGLTQGEIMEVLVPYGSSFAYRHVGSIAQAKWKIAAIYRDGKQILPTNATMIYPQDTLLILGKPQVLANVYRRISKNNERFPEPFGRNIYLLLDMQMDISRALSHLRESMHLAERLEHAQLYVRLINPGNLDVVEQFKKYESDHIHIHVQYGDKKMSEMVHSDTDLFNIGLIMLNHELFKKSFLMDEVLGLKKLIFLFGNSPLFSVERIILLLSEEEEMESISSTFFYVAETLELKPCLCHYVPDGDYKQKKRVVDHYETLARIFQYPLKVDEKAINPIRAVASMNHVLQVAPLTSKIQDDDMFKIFSTKLSDYLLDSTQHPKLLIPAEA